MQTTTNEAEVNVVLIMLAGESSDSARTELTSAAAGHVLGEDEGAPSPRTVCCKRLPRTGHLVAPSEGKKRKKRLQRSSSLELGANSTILALGCGRRAPTLRMILRIAVEPESMNLCLMRMKRKFPFDS
jgi:hypothetical protein